MKLIITRHGETVENTKGIIQGHLPGHLSENGKLQANKLATRLKNQKINIIYSSDLKRATDTLNEIKKYHKNTITKKTRILREIYLGERQGKSINSINEKAKPIDGESQEHLFERAKRFINRLLLRHNRETILLVAHGGINRALIANLIGKKIDDIENLKNTSVSIFIIDNKGKVKTELFNCNKHLD